MSSNDTYDVIVVGGGNAGFSAATTAAQQGAKRVLLVEKAPEENAGGNTYFTAAGYRTVFGGLGDLLPMLYQPTGVKGLEADLVEKIEMAPYTKEDFHGVCLLHLLFWFLAIFDFVYLAKWVADSVVRILIG
jgi:glycine/D-amino acid oxidase-like deaminating enzyme